MASLFLFDRVCSSALSVALLRFGLPKEMVDMIVGIYAQRNFVVRDPFSTSNKRPQKAGIAQGCPLSPYLFVVMMTVLFTDVDAEMCEKGLEQGIPNSKTSWLEVAYADDTALMAEDSGTAQTLLNVVVEKALVYGLEPNWDKTVHLLVRHHTDINNNAGQPLTTTARATYLGAVVDSSGLSNGSLARRLGEARGALDKLNLAWRHTGITRTRKTELLNAIVMSKLLYGLEILCLRAADRARVDAFQAQALRKALGILPSYFSRVSNAEVLRRANQLPLSQVVLYRQMMLFGRIAAQPNDSYIRQATF